VPVLVSLLVALAALPSSGAAQNPGPDRSSTSPEKLLYQQALTLYRAHKWTEAAALLERGAAKYPKNPGIASLLGWTRLRLSEIAPARRAFEAAAAAAPDLADPKTGLGYVALREKRPAQAEAFFSKAIDLDPNGAEAWKGLGIVWRDRGDRKGAHEAFSRAVAVAPADAEAQALLRQAQGPDGILEERRGRGRVAASRPLRIVARAGKGYLEIREKDRFRPIFIKGVNLGTALPGKFPAEFPDDPALYRRWFDQMSELGLNVVRLYTLHPPSLYRALREHNRARPGRKLWLVQGVWTELPPNDDYDAPAFFGEFTAETRRVIDAIHGNIELPARPGHAHGRYDADVSGDLLAILLGREWEPYSVVAYERMRPTRKSFDGKYVRAGTARPFEAWLASICDAAAQHATEHYRTQHPVGYVSWPTLDPLHHPTEATGEEETAIRTARGEKLAEPIEEYDNDAVNLDATRIRATAEYPAGFYASYHAYPYYPEFMVLDPEYAKARDAEGPSHYLGYLKALKAHHRDQPVVIAEFGVPTSRGIAHLQPQGQHHGGHNAVEQGRINARLFRNLHEAGLAGGILFAWIDEWFKRNWLVMAFESPPERNPLWLNALDPEQNYGLIAAVPGRPGGKVVLDGKGEDWGDVGPLYKDDARESRAAFAAGSSFRRLRGLRVTHDEAYLYLRLDLEGGRGPIDWTRTRYWVGIDTYDPDRGDHRFPRPVDVTVPIGMEFLVRFEGAESRVLVDPPYDLFTMRNHRPYRSVRNSIGDFTEIRVFTNRDRFGRDGTHYPPKGYSRSPMRRGSLDPLSPDYDTLADWYESPAGDFVEARIPWGLLNVADPSSRQVIHEDSRRRGQAGTKTTEGFRFHLLSLAAEKGTLQVVDRLPRSASPTLAEYPVYSWQGWESPTYHLAIKDSYRILKDALQAIPEHPDAK
jgi:hypothetical protein